jgi:iron(II)-dependent oxidoreductase
VTQHAMVANALKSSQPSATADRVREGLARARANTLALVAHLDDEQLERVHSPIMSPLVWDLGHIAAYEDLWLAHRLGERSLLRPELAALYDAFETPRAVRGDIEMLGPADARGYMDVVRARSIETLAERSVGDGVICEMVIRHELQHGETMRQTLAIANLLNDADAAASDEPLQPSSDEPWVAVAAGPFELGAPPEEFSYDNERPRHGAETAAFEIARRPLSNGELLRFAEEGGYAQRELWSAEGWAWLQEQPESHHRSIAEGHPDATACHVSWFEAEAYAMAHDARLPSEAEWEKAATLHAAELDGLGRAWEWTRSHFDGYPGFVAYPYREYSEVFFGEGYRVLRGGSWATDARVAGVHFRNWDLPQRRQIFAGVRLSRAGG